YLISSQITIKPSVTQATTATGAYVHSSDLRKVHIYSESRAIIKASAVMTNMFLFTFNSADANGIAPFYSVVEGLQFDGNNKATTGILLDWTMHGYIEKNVFVGLSNGIQTASGQG